MFKKCLWLALASLSLCSSERDIWGVDSTSSVNQNSKVQNYWEVKQWIEKRTHELAEQYKIEKKNLLQESGKELQEGVNNPNKKLRKHMKQMQQKFRQQAERELMQAQNENVPNENVVNATKINDESVLQRKHLQQLFICDHIKKTTSHKPLIWGLYQHIVTIGWGDENINTRERPDVTTLAYMMLLWTQDTTENYDHFMEVYERLCEITLRDLSQNNLKEKLQRCGSEHIKYFVVDQKNMYERIQILEKDHKAIVTQPQSLFSPGNMKFYTEEGVNIEKTPVFPEKIVVNLYKRLKQKEIGCAIENLKRVVSDIAQLSETHFYHKKPGITERMRQFANNLCERYKNTVRDDIAKFENATTRIINEQHQK